MIYVGYQGVGKSSVCNKIDKCIDLESSNFFIDNQRHEDWYKIYAKIADNLSKQGKIVFMSSHKILREYMVKKRINFTVIYPALELKDEWVKRLKTRFEETHLDKDFKAWINAKESYLHNIHDLSKEKNKVVIRNLDYKLEDLLKL